MTMRPLLEAIAVVVVVDSVLSALWAAWPAATYGGACLMLVGLLVLFWRSERAARPERAASEGQELEVIDTPTPQDSAMSDVPESVREVIAWEINLGVAGDMRSDAIADAIVSALRANGYAVVPTGKHFSR